MAGRIQVSRDTAERIQLAQSHDLTFRGKVEAKGKGAVDTFFLGAAAPYERLLCACLWRRAAPCGRADPAAHCQLPRCLHIARVSARQRLCPRLCRCAFARDSSEDASKARGWCVRRS